MAKKKENGLVEVVFTHSPGKYDLAYFKGDTAEIEAELAALLIEDGLAILKDAEAATEEQEEA
jgi:hypothetical protein